MRPRAPAATARTPTSEPWRPEAPLEGELVWAAAPEPEPVAVLEPDAPLLEPVEVAPESVGVADEAGYAEPWALISN